MGWIENFTNWLDAWKSIDLAELGMDSIEASEEKVIEFNKVQLREQGIRPDGSELKPYAPSTVRIKQAEGKEWRFRTLLDTGAFQSRMTMLQQGHEFDFDSSDPKTSEIIAREGDVFGLTSEHERKTWAEITRPYIIQVLKQIPGVE